MAPGHVNGRRAIDIDLATSQPWRAGFSEISPAARLAFAKQVLCGLAIIAGSVMIAYGLNPENSALQAMFEFVKIGVPPLVTLLVTFYFPIKK